VGLRDIFRIRWRGLRRTKRKLQNPVWRRWSVLAKRKVDFWLDRTLAEVRAGEWFDNPTGQLENGLWKRQARRKGFGDIGGQVGWGHRYGPLLEWGPRPGVTGWIILPKRAKALRFMVAGGGGRSGGVVLDVVYSKRVAFKWRPDMKREHFGPVTKRLRPDIIRDLEMTISEAYGA
jgi:hypothetical protein